MNEAFLKFERDGLDGVVAVGSYLSDAARRLGVDFDGSCAEPETKHECVFTISNGQGLLSKHTAIEIEQLSPSARKNGERLGCQTYIEKAGEIDVMTVKKKKTEAKKDEKVGGFKEEFTELPLEKKIASLVELEAIALGETFSYVLNSPYKAVGKVMDIMAGFGLKRDMEDKEAARPQEHKKAANGTKEKATKSKSKATTRKATTRKTTTRKKRTTAAKKDSKSSAKKKAVPKDAGKKSTGE